VVIAGSASGAVFCWNFENGAKLYDFEKGSESIRKVATLPDGTSALAFDHGVWLFNYVLGTEKFYSTGLNTSSDISEDCRLGLFGTKDGKVEVWHLFNSEKIGEVLVKPLVKKVRFLLNGSMYVLTDNSSFQVWQLFDGQNNFKPLLKGISNEPRFSANQTMIDKLQGLSDKDRRHLIEHGAIEFPEGQYRCTTM
jgi:WD40 repeat protein